MLMIIFLSQICVVSQTLILANISHILYRITENGDVRIISIVNQGFIRTLLGGVFP